MAGHTSRTLQIHVFIKLINALNVFPQSLNVVKVKNVLYKQCSYVYAYKHSSIDFTFNEMSFKNVPNNN